MGIQDNLNNAKDQVEQKTGKDFDDPAQRDEMKNQAQEQINNLRNKNN